MSFKTVYARKLHFVTPFEVTNTQIVYCTAKVELDPLALNELRSEADAFITKAATSKQILVRVSRVLGNNPEYLS